MFRWFFFERRKQRLPVIRDRRKPTMKEAQAMLRESIERFDQTVTLNQDKIRDLMERAFK